MKNFAGVGVGMGLAFLIVMGPTYGLIFGLMRVAIELVDPQFLTLVLFGIEGTAGLLGVIIGSYVSGGITEVALKTARGEMTSVGDVFGGGKYFMRMLVANLCAAVVISIGNSLCVAPGVFLTCALFGYQCVVVDQGLGGIEALKKAWEQTEGHRLNIFIFVLLGIPLVFAGSLACGIGVLLGTLPILAVGQAYIYLRIKGEHPRLPAG